MHSTRIFLALFFLSVPLTAQAEECPFTVSEGNPSWQEEEEGIEYGVFSYHGDEKKLEGPVIVHLMRVDLSKGGLTLRSLRPPGQSLKIEEIIQTFRNEGVDVRAAINGDYFSFFEAEKNPLGLHISDGQVLRFPASTTSLVVDADNRLHMDRYELKQVIEGAGIRIAVTGANRSARANESVLFSGYYLKRTKPQRGCAGLLLARDSLEPMVNGRVKVTVEEYFPARRSVKLKPLNLALVVCGPQAALLKRVEAGTELTIKTTVEGFDGVMVEAISGGPRILRDGKLSVETNKEGFSLPLKLYIPRKHPRSAVGVSADGRIAYLLVAEGRSKKSSGLTASQAACLLLQVGASDAMLFDGGGSAVLMGMGKFYNLPHSKRNWTARDIANALAVVKKGNKGTTVRGRKPPNGDKSSGVTGRSGPDGAGHP